MKHLETLLVAKSVAAVAIAAASIATPIAAHAAEQDGVTCDPGLQATLANGILTCKKQKVLASICSPIAFGKTASVNTNVVMNPIGSDKCLAVGTGTLVDSVMTPPTPGIDPPASAYHRVINASGPDTFVAEQFVYPATGNVGNLPYPPAPPGDASRGVKCPSGFNSVGINGNRGLRCEKVDVKRAGCDTGWTIERHSGRDLCVMTTLVGRLEGNYTIPEGANYTGLIGNPETHGWNLDTDRSGTTDFWVAERKTFKYPDAL
jgi:hypothetical protein